MEKEQALQDLSTLFHKLIDKVRINQAVVEIKHELASPTGPEEVVTLRFEPADKTRIDEAWLARLQAAHKKFIDEQLEQAQRAQ